MGRPRVSVIVPTYKTAKYLPKCLDSILNQTFQDFEIIIVSDGPEEDHKIADEYAQRDSRITVLKDIKKDLGGARNAGIQLSKGEYICSIDSDDWIEPDYLEKMCYGADQGADIVQCGTNIIFEGPVDPVLKQGDEKYFSITLDGLVPLKNDIFGNMNVGTWNKLYKKELIDKYNLKFPENLRNEDAYFTWAYWSVCKNMYCIPDKLYNYLRRDTSLMAKTFAKDMDSGVLDHLRIMEHLYEFLQENHLFSARKEAFYRAYLVSWYFVQSYGSAEFQKQGHEIARAFLKGKRIPSCTKKLKKIAKYPYESFSSGKKWSFAEKIFSIKNSDGKTHKIITILGIKLKIKRKKRPQHKYYNIQGENNKINVNYNEIIPIGSDCLVAVTLKDLGLRNNSYPFDWLYKATNDFFITAMDCILNDFDGFYDLSNLEVDGKVGSPHNTWRIKNKKYGFVFIHDYKLDKPALSNYNEIRARYDRRIARLKNILLLANKVLLLHMSQTKIDDNICIEKINEIQERFNNKNINLLLLEHDETKKENEIEYIKLNQYITKVLYNNDYKFSPIKNDSWWRNQEIYTKIIKENCKLYPKISVIMPTYNAEKYLRESIDSILNQTFTDFEFLIVDDNSTDSTREIVNSYTDKRIRLVDGPCHGLAAALNMGIREARGEYIARMDADDISLPNRFALQYKFLDSHKDISMIGSWQKHFGNSNWIHCPPANPDVAKITLMLGCEMCHSTVMFRREDFINNNLLYPEKSPQEDYELWGDVIGKVKVANIPQILGKYRVSNGNITNDKLDILDEYEAKLSVRNLKKYLDIDVDASLVQKRNNPYWKMNKKQKTDFQQRLNDLYELIEKQNQKYQFINHKNIVKALAHNWDLMCGEKCYIKSKYYSSNHNIFKLIFSIKNSINNRHKIITILGVKIKIRIV